MWDSKITVRIKAKSTSIKPAEPTILKWFALYHLSTNRKIMKTVYRHLTCANQLPFSQTFVIYFGFRYLCSVSFQYPPYTYPPTLKDEKKLKWKIRFELNGSDHTHAHTNTHMMESINGININEIHQTPCETIKSFIFMTSYDKSYFVTEFFFICLQINRFLCCPRTSYSIPSIKGGLHSS